MPLTLELPLTEDQPTTPSTAAVETEESSEAVRLLTEDDEQSEQPEPPQPAAGECAETASDQQVNVPPAPAEPASQPEAVLPPASGVRYTTDRRDVYLRQKAAMEEHIAALTIEEAKLKQHAKLAKKEREVLTEQLSDLIDGWEAAEDNDEQPATAGGDAGSLTYCSWESTQAGLSPECPASQPVLPDTTEDDQARYRQVLEAAKVGELSLAPKITEKLTEAGATTIWALEQLRAEISQGRAKWPKGIGEAKVTVIEDAIMNWMARNQETWAPNQRDGSQAGNLVRTPEGCSRLAGEEIPQVTPQEMASAVGCSIDDL